MQQTELSDAYERVEALREGLAELPIDIGRPESVNITSSFGVTLLDPSVEIEQCLDRADKAFYEAKSQARNCTRVWCDFPRSSK